jgi:PKD repeat protein
MQSQSTRVLFIGNSYTGVNNLPTLTKNLALSLMDTLIVDSNTPGGTTFSAHTNNATTLNKIGQGTWDYVILQAQSQEPSFPPSQVAAQTYPYAAILVDSIISANECAIPLFYMTWGRQNGDASNCTSYPVICTYDGMQSRLRASYLEMATDNDAEVSPVGAAWKYVRDNHPSINLYSADESHPSAAGSYLAACVHYASIYKKSPVGASYTFSLTNADATILQNAAKLVVIDSLENWNFGARDVTSDFNYTNSANLTFDFTNNSNNATTYFWDFGDGNTSVLEDPTHSYSNAGNYTVTLSSISSCDSITSQALITVVDASIGITSNPNVQIKIEQINNMISLTSNKLIQGDIFLYNLEGKIITKINSTGTTNELQIPQSRGVYILNWTDENGQIIFTKKVFI